MEVLMQIVHSAREAEQHAQSRKTEQLPVFPASVFAQGHGLGSEGVKVQDVSSLTAAVEQAIGVSNTEFGRDGAEIHWPS